MNNIKFVFVVLAGLGFGLMVYSNHMNLRTIEMYRTAGSPAVDPLPDYTPGSPVNPNVFPNFMLHVEDTETFAALEIADQPLESAYVPNYVNDATGLGIDYRPSQTHAADEIGTLTKGSSVDDRISFATSQDELEELIVIEGLETSDDPDVVYQPIQSPDDLTIRITTADDKQWVVAEWKEEE